MPLDNDVIVVIDGRKHDENVISMQSPVSRRLLDSNVVRSIIMRGCINRGASCSVVKAESDVMQTILPLYTTTTLTTHIKVPSTLYELITLKAIQLWRDHNPQSYKDRTRVQIMRPLK
jgi:hypothetical protein